MKNTTMNLMLATAALLVASTVASAQGLKAEIPFSFRYGNTVMAPGAYLLTTSGSHMLLQLRRADGSDGIFLAASIPEDPPQAWVRARQGVLEFTCGDSGCDLKRLWTGDSNHAFAFSSPKKEEGKGGHL